MKELLNDSKIKKLLDTINDNVWIVDKDLNYIFCNKNFKKYGWEPSELIGKSISLMATKESFDLCKEAVLKYMSDPSSHSNQTLIITSRYKDSDETYIAECNVSVLMDKENVIGFCGISRDITERTKILTEYSNVKQALEISGGLCHEISQPFQIISGYIDLLVLDKKLDEHGSLIVDTIYKQLGRIREILCNLSRISCYETKSYTSKSRIFDIEKST